jgi:PKD repeat protein
MITANSYFLVGQPVRFNATIQYPDGTNLRSPGQVFASLIYSGGGYNDSVSVVFDTNLQLWVGTYTPQVYEPGGLWSLTVKAWDSPSVPPSNSGSATKAVTLQDRLPTASFTKSSSTALTGAQITFNATTSSDIDGTISSYNWDFGDGSTGSGSIVTHSFSVAGTYTVKLNVTDNGGLTSQYTSAVTVQASSSPSSGNVSFPLYYFGVLAAVIAALIVGLFLAFRRHKVTHARLKIDLEAVKAEAGRIENQEFFQSVKDQLKKDKE